MDERLMCAKGGIPTLYMQVQTQACCCKPTEAWIPLRTNVTDDIQQNRAHVQVNDCMGNNRMLASYGRANISS